MSNNRLALPTSGKSWIRHWYHYVGRTFMYNTQVFFLGTSRLTNTQSTPKQIILFMVHLARLTLLVEIHYGLTYLCDYDKYPKGRIL